MSKNANKPDRASSRAAARLAAVQALYQMDIGGIDLPTTIGQFRDHVLGRVLDGAELNEADEPFFQELLEDVVSDQHRIDRSVDKALAEGWPLARVDSILRAILRSGACELFNREKVPARVAINEYVDIAKAFFDGEETGIVNGVLDRVAREARPGELDTPRASA